MLGFIIGNMVVGAGGYLFYLAGYALGIGLLLAIPYLLISRIYFLIANVFHFLVGGLFTLDDVCDVFITVYTVPVDIFCKIVSYVWDLLSMISLIH